MSIKKVAIFEKSEAKLVKSGSGNWVFEGIFASIGVKNNNNRIYTENEYIPQIEALQPKIKANKLLGELDHPQRFETELKDASHIVKELRYDKATKKVVGKIQLIEGTRWGDQAIAFVKAGVPLHISSRAAGSVNEKTGEVKIQKLFTYDLVADPGFSEAELNLVSENNHIFLNESLNIQNENLLIAELPSDWVWDEEEKNESKKTSNMDYISVQDFEEYTQNLKTEINSLKRTINKLTELKEENSNFEVQSIIEKIIGHNDYIIEGLNAFSSYNDKQTEVINKLAEYSSKLSKRINENSLYSDKQTKTINNLIEYVDKISEQVNNLTKYLDNVTERVNQNTLYSEKQTNHINQITEWVESNFDKANERFQQIEDHSDHIVQRTNKLAEYTDKVLGENLRRSIAHTDYIVKKINEGYNGIGNATKSENWKTNLENRVDSILESKRIKERANPFSLLGESKRKIFQNLTLEKQETIMEAFEKNAWFSMADAERIWESCFVENKRGLDWLNDAPEKYQKIWEGLNENQKTAIRAQASLRVLDTPYKINDFWATRTFGEKRLINESTNFQNRSSEDYIRAIRERFDL